MDRNVSLPKRAGLAGVLVVAVALIWFLIGAQGGSGATTPEEAVRAVYQHCSAGDFGMTAPYYLGGPQHDAAMRESICRKITLEGQMAGWELKSQQTVGQEMVVETLSYKDAATKLGARIISWRLVQKGRHWLVGEV